MAPTYEWTAEAGRTELAQDRRGLLRRTYGHLMGAIVVFTIIELVLFKTGAIDKLAPTLMRSQGGWLLILGAFILVGWLATRTAASSISPTAQYVALFGFVAAEAVLFAPILYVADRTAPGAIRSAALITLLGFGGLTAIVFMLKEDFSFLGGILRFAGWMALVTIVAAVLFQFQLGVWFSVAMIALAGASVLYDTSTILKHYPADRHVLGALQLFASVAMMFFYVLRLVMQSRD
jgi:uncharacterized protein